MPTSSPGWRRTAGRWRTWSPVKKGKGGKGAGKGGFLDDFNEGTGLGRCRAFNKGKCAYGDACAFEHSCNFPRCGKIHARVDVHPNKPEGGDH